MRVSPFLVEVKETNQADADSCSIEVRHMVLGGVILTLLDLFTHFSLSGPWVEMEGTVHPSIVCTP